MTQDSTYADKIEAWRKDRLAALTAEDGWLDLTDRIEIAPGKMSVGSAPDNQIVISVGPAHLGTLALSADGSASFTTDKGTQDFAPVPDNPPRLKVGDLLLEATSLEGQYALRVRDTASPARTDFPGIDSYPIDPNWRIEAQWRKLETPIALGIGTVAGIDTSVELTHDAQFTHDGQVVTLLPTHWKSGKPMFVVRDKTSGRETYGASRFLIGEVQGDTIVLDFNKAFNPPCAFTEFAVCPLPPRQNIMPFEIRAGEKKPL